MTTNAGTKRDSLGVSLSLRDVVVTLYRRKFVVLAITIPIVVAGGIAIFSQARSYVASARVLVELSNVDQPRWNVNSNLIDYDRELSTLFNIAMSASVVEMAAESLEDSIPVIRNLSEEFQLLEGGSELAMFLMDSANVTVVGESRILEFQVRAPHPRLALMGVRALRDAFVDYQIHGQKNSEAVGYYEEQIAIVRTQVDSLLAERSQVLARTGYTEMEGQLRDEAGSLINAEYKLMEARTAREIAELEYRVLREALQRDPRSFPMGQVESRSSPLVYWRHQVSEHEDALFSLMTTHKAQSQPVLRQKAVLANALESLKREAGTYVESVRMNLEGLRTKERELSALTDRIRARNQDAPEAYYKISLIDAETASLREVMENLQGKLGEVRLSLQADERVSSLVNLTKPELVPMFSGGKSVLYFLMLSFMGLALGVVAAFVLEILDHRISQPDEISEYMELPVFASITKG